MCVVLPYIFKSQVLYAISALCPFFPARPPANCMKMLTCVMPTRVHCMIYSPVLVQRTAQAIHHRTSHAMRVKFPCVTPRNPGTQQMRDSGPHAQSSRGEISSSLSKSLLEPSGDMYSLGGLHETFRTSRRSQAVKVTLVHTSQPTYVRPTT
ncbi:hypothetical protein OH77DRAFT_564653 [Trametes cingulata]|nr:hypothetical protein OH77DRAFT_564653 [Trametes cingulata]